MNKQKVGGALLSYLNIAFGFVVNFLLTPLLIGYLTDDIYSLYKVIQSFAAPFAILNMGVSTIVSRSVARYRAVENGDKREKENTLFAAIVVSSAMALCVVGIAYVLKFQIPTIYGSNYTAEQIRIAEKIFMFFSCSTAVRIVTDPFFGCINGNERFVFQYGTQLMQYAIRFGLIFLFVKLGYDVVAVSMVDLIANGILLVVSMVYSFGRLKEFPKFHYYDKNEMVGIVSFSVSILLQAIINQVNNNVDLMILGNMETNKTIITMYSSALTVFMVYNSLISVFSAICFPTATKLVTKNASKKELTDFVIAPGRIQAIVAVGLVTAFALFGKTFITVWIGAEYVDAYSVILMLIIPVSIPLVQNVCLSILDAELKRLFRSVVLVIMAVFNVALSIVLYRYFGFYGVALGTTLSLLIGHILIMNIYYQKVIGLEVFRMFREIFRGILPVGAITGALCLPLAIFMKDTFGSFVIQCVVFVGVYAVLLWKFGLTEKDKSILKNMRKTN